MLGGGVTYGGGGLSGIDLDGVIDVVSLESLLFSPGKLVDAWLL